MMSAAFEWTRSRTTQFITAFYIHPCLWKIKSSDYKNKVSKQTAAESVHAEMGKEALTVQDVLKKISNFAWLIQERKEMNSVVNKIWGWNR